MNHPEANHAEANHAAQSGRGLRLRILGFPVHLDLSFVVVMGLLGYASGLSTVPAFVLWLAITPVAVLVHELGHAVLARTTGARPEIVLTGFGGVTSFVPPEPLSRARSLAISLAGPGVGLVLGGGLLAVYLPLAAREQGQSWLLLALWFGVFTTIGWSLLNLLPVLPLDGGQAMRELLPGDPEQRTRRAAVASLILLVPLAVLAYLFVSQWTALLLVFFGLSNVLELRRGSGRAVPAGTPGGMPGPGTAGDVSPEQAAVAFLWSGSAEQARALMEQLPPGVPIDLAVHGAVQALTGQAEQGEALLRQEVARRPTDPNPVALLFLTLALNRDWDRLEAELRGPLGARVPRAVLDRAAQEAWATGRPEVATRLTAGGSRS